MGKAKDIVLRPVTAGEANALVKRVHYSGKVVQNSQLHIGVFYDGKLEGAMQFGPSLDKRKIQGLVSGTAWHEFIELNRMAFSEVLPRNSESRAIAVAMRLLRQHAPQVKWVISFADGTQCGDGTIYRASGFVLTGIKENDRLISFVSEPLPQYRNIVEAYRRDFDTMHPLYFQAGQRQSNLQKMFVAKFRESGGNEKRFVSDLGADYKIGFQLRYIYFIDPTYRARLTVPELPYSEIERMGARMYKGQRIHAAGAADVATDDQSDKGGLIPTPPLHSAID